MKKKNYLYAAGLMLAAAFTSCMDETEGIVNIDKLEVSAVMGNQSRTTLEDNSKTVTWCSGDKIYLFDANGTSKGTLSLKEGAGEETASFSGTVTGSLSKIDKALYPVPTVSGGEYMFDFPAARTWSANSAAPMIGDFDYANKHVQFRNLVALIRVDLNGYNYTNDSELVLTMTGGPFISGTASVDVDAKELTIAEGDNTVTVTGFGSARFVDIPVPAGTYSNYSVTIDGVLLAEGTGETLDRNSVAILGQKEVVVTPNEEGIYEIHTAAEMFWLAEQVNSGKDYFEGKTVKLMEDINMSLRDWTPIGGNYNNNARNFKGIFDGNGKTISGLNVRNVTYAALFGRTSGNCQIKNLTIADSYFEDGGNAACLVSFVLGSLELESVSAVNSNVLANGVEYPNRLIGSTADDAMITIDNAVLVNTTDELFDAINAGKENIILADGNYVMPDGFSGAHDTYNQKGYNDNYPGVNLRNKTLTISGTRNAVISAEGIDERDQFVTDANLAFEGVTINFGIKNYMGFANAANLTYNNCAINGLQFCYGSGTYAFVGCDLNSNGAEHCVWTWGGQNVEFTDCTFTYGDRAVNCYGENVTTDVSFNNCTFNKVTGKQTTGAIETNSSQLSALNLTINNCSVNEGDLWWVSTWDTAKGAKTYTTINGKVAVGTAQQLATVVANGATDIYLMDGNYDIEGCASKTLTLNGSKNAVLNVTPAGQGEANGQLDYGFDGATVTFNGITIMTNSQLYAGYARLSAVYNDCVIQNTYNLGVGTSEFNDCVFNITNEYLRIGGAYSATFDGCEFNTDGRAILIFQDGTKNDQNVTVKDCTFNATASAHTWNGIHVAAVSYDGSQGGTYIVTFEGENIVDSDFNGLWQIKAGETNVTVNGLN